MIDIADITKEVETLLSGLTFQNTEDLKVSLLGRKDGVLTSAFRALRELPEAEKRVVGPQLSALREKVEVALKAVLDQHADAQIVDLTLTAIPCETGTLHPLTQTQQELEDIFKRLGFVSYLGPEVETEFYNFTALNIPENHPARDMWDTFYIKQRNTKGERLLLRTHTSPMQVRFMQQHKPPFAVLFPGVVYRHEATDATHEHTFQQLEGLVVGENISFAQMSWTFETVLKQYFGSQTKVKMMPSFFPFTEPSAEVAISHPDFRGGKWLELLGCGMVNQKVFEAAGYPKGKYTGFAFGSGLTRFAMMKYKIPDIRMLSENKIEFLKQF
ncbi:MAG TPA: phenylalanine--tRNA ligase subunit alpha [Patescibacteria group bacterium]|nr:phenylalanine--tRNA ligase subunit alpha [Patescibacteria group bacterium]